MMRLGCAAPHQKTTDDLGQHCHSQGPGASGHHCAVAYAALVTAPQQWEEERLTC